MNNKITQNKIAMIVGVAQSHISGILNKKKKPSADVASKLELATGISRLHWLYPDEFDEQGNSFAGNPNINIEACSQTENSDFNLI